MNALDLLRDWPGWKQAGAGKVLASPAWRLDVIFADRKGSMRIVPNEDLADDRLTLKVDLEGEEHRLGISDSAVFADLHRIWKLRDRLPYEVLMAVVEKECGPLLQMLEDVLRRQLSVKGLDETASDVPFRAFRVTFPEGGEDAFSFSLDLSPAMEIDLGRIENLDVTDESIRGMSRPAEASYAEFDLPDADLADGDLLLRTEEFGPQWLTDVPRDGHVRVLADKTLELTFAELADGAPPVPPSPTYRLVRDGELLANATSAQIGSHPAFRIISTLQPFNPLTL